MKAFNSLENGEEYILFFLRMMLDCLECVHQFKESILKCFSRERQRKRSHFDGIFFWPFQKERTETHSISLWNGSERFLSRWRTVFEPRRKHSVIVWNGKECVPLDSECFFSFMNAFTNLWNAFFKQKTSFHVFMNALSSVFFHKYFSLGSQVSERSMIKCFERHLYK